MNRYQRRFPVGAEPTPHGTVHLRVWAPRRRKVEIVVESETSKPLHCIALTEDGEGYFAVETDQLRPGSRYRFRLDGESGLYPDPASRFQPDGPHGSSQVVDPQFSWSDQVWRGVELEGQVLYELHIGTFTPEGTWRAAADRLSTLADLGVTLVEVMPVADFPGRFGWGYDGVNLFAPTRLYGTPDDFRRFVDRAHGLGLGVILDIVYNHLGPDGNYLGQFSDRYLSERYQSEWGDAINFDGPGAGPVREFFVANAGYWIDEFHLDGLRLDATQQIFDTSERHILAELTKRVRHADQGRRTVVIAENETQEVRLIQPPEQRGFGIDALWNDDFHHAAIVALTGWNEAYFSDYRGSPQEFVSSAKHGFLYQGQWYTWQGKRRGTPTLGVPRQRFVTYIENHDQVSNSARGDRVTQLTSPARWRALTALLLLGPGTPLLFMGQEFAASTPFLFFADHEPELAAKVRTGRADFLAQFPSLAEPAVRASLPDPADPHTFERCRLDWSELDRHRAAWELHRDLIALRKSDPVLRRQGADGLDGAVLGPSAFVLRWLAPEGDDRLLLVNLGTTLHFSPAPEPLLAPPAGRRWEQHWSSQDPRYGGLGVPPVEGDELNWRLPGESAVLFVPTSDAVE
ncbi:MAG TPA: malto-oligosyltrehalose trehalohydrolase [Gemmatimonadales bacterium]|nr:malto-oligosyltrehalose trehalohydrolase [Gemmatimonadales bacterium]